MEVGAANDAAVVGPLLKLAAQNWCTDRHWNLVQMRIAIRAIRTALTVVRAALIRILERNAISEQTLHCLWNGLA